MTDQPLLFDPARTTTARCPICHAERQPQDERATGCAVDQDRQAGDWRSRPAACLNQPQPSNDIPY
jgi:hypothetical protein